MYDDQILLCPRPYAQYSGRLLLLPLLPYKPILIPLPSEIWSEIFQHVLAEDEGGSSKVGGIGKSSVVSLLVVCKSFMEVALPLLYSNVQMTMLPSLERFTTHLYASDQKWDSIRRIPYSTPGRWVQVFDLSALDFTSRSEAILLDCLLTKLFPLLPFLSQFTMNPSFMLSYRAMDALGTRDGAMRLRILEGISYIPSHGSMNLIEEEPLVRLLRCCPNLQELEIIGQGLDPMEIEFSSVTGESELLVFFTPLNLQHLHTMTLLSVHSSPLLLSLLRSPLPSLRKLMITPYDDIPYPTSLVSQFIDVHGHSLRSLLLFTPKSWPTRRHPSPRTLLHSSPNLRHLSLENPVPALIGPPDISLSAPHPLQILSIPRPSSEIWNMLERLLPVLPSLKAVRTRDVRWLRRGMTSRALQAGVQGEMGEWRRRLARRGIKVLDAHWKESE